jgi:ribosomal protein S18 acetylase RimI-like enzyme
MHGVEIRIATKEDFDGIFLLLQQLWPNKELDKNALMTVFRRGLDYRSNIYFCAEINSTVVGFCSLIIRNSLWQEGFLGYIDELVVDKSFRGRDIGSNLMNEAMDNAKEKGCKRLELDSAFENEDAHRFYERLGLEKRAHLFSKEL